MLQKLEFSVSDRNILCIKLLFIELLVTCRTSCLFIHFFRRTTGRGDSLRADSILRAFRFRILGTIPHWDILEKNIFMVCLTKKTQIIINQLLSSISSKMISNVISGTHKLEEHVSERMVRLGFRLQTGIQSGKKVIMDLQNGLNVGKQDLCESKRQILRKSSKINANFSARGKALDIFLFKKPHLEMSQNIKLIGVHE